MTARKSTTEVDPEIAAVADQPIEPEQVGQQADEVLNIFQRVAAISREAGALAPEAKGGVPFAFRGVDGTVAHLAPLLNKYGVFFVPAGGLHVVRDREIFDKQGNATGRIVKTTELEQSYHVCGPDGIGFTTTAYGLADDFADRSTAQAQSVAFRIMLLQLFHLPTHDREPEQAGEDVQKGIAAANAGTADASAPRGPKAVEAAKAASAPTQTVLSRLQAEAKALGRKLGVDSDELNALGSKLSGTNDADVWFNDPLIMEQIRDNLKARAEA